LGRRRGWYDPFVATKRATVSIDDVIAAVDAYRARIDWRA